MPSKLQIINDIYDTQISNVTSNQDNWKAFLKTAANNYKYSFSEQILIYAQKPEATACAEIGVWNNRFNRYINRGVKGIALIKELGDTQKLRYVFDVSDTNSLSGQTVSRWEVNPDYEIELCNALKEAYDGIPDGGLAEAIKYISANIVKIYGDDYLSALDDAKDNSFLEGLDRDSLSVLTKNSLISSVGYMIMYRCGIDADVYYTNEDFEDIFNFNTKKSVIAFGDTLSSMSEIGLREIEKNSKNINRTFAIEKQSVYNRATKDTEGSFNNVRNNIQTSWRLYDSEHRLSGGRQEADRQMGNAPQGLPETEQAHNLRDNVYGGNADKAPFGSSGAGNRDDGAVSITDGESRGSDGTAQSGRPNEMGGSDEQHSALRRGNSPQGTDLHLSNFDFDFYRSDVGYFHQDSEKNELLREYLKPHKDEIAEFYEGHTDRQERSDFLMSFFTSEPFEITLSNGVNAGIEAYSDAFYMWRGDRNNPTNEELGKWHQIERAVFGMILLEEWTEPQALLLPTMDAQIEKVKLKDGYLPLTIPQSAIDYVIGGGSSFSEGKFRIYEQFEKSLSKDDNIRFLKNEYGTGGHTDAIPGSGYWESHDAKGIEIQDYYSEPKRKMLLTWSQVEKRISELIKLDRYLSSKELEMYPQWLAKQEELQIERAIEAENRKILATAPPEPITPKEYIYEYHLGDTVFIGADEFTILSFDDEKVMLNDSNFPLFTRELERSDFDLKVKENPANDHLKVEVTEKQKTEIATENKPNKIEFSIGFSEHPCFYERKDEEFVDRYTNVSFAVGNHLLNVLDQKQNSERANKEIGWYHKTDFKISVTIDGVDFNYDGRFDIGDGEGDLIAHIKNYYDYCLSPKCLYVSHWKEQGEDYYREQMESLQWGRDVFVPFLEQNKELSAEEQHLFDEIMSHESEWFPEAEKTTVVTAYPVGDFYELYGEEAEKVAELLDLHVGKRNDEPLTGFPKHVINEYSDKLSELGYSLEVKEDNPHIISQKVNQENVIGKEITIDNRKYVVESVGTISGDVSLRDITFNESVGFPINRVERIDKIRELIDTQSDLTPSWENEPKEKITTLMPDVSDAQKHDYKITDDNLGVGGAKEKFRNNMTAINLLHEIEFDGRLATPEEQEILAKYVGFGGLADAFDESKDNWKNEFTELYTALSPEEYSAARESTLTAFYTPPVVIKSMYKALENMGFKNGNILEPSCGVGNFIGLKPDSMADSKIYGVELDSLTGRIAQQLYQKANIAVQGYETTNLPDSFFDVAIGNVPFGQFSVNDKKYNKNNWLIHDYFFGKSLDKVRPGGVIAFVTSSGTMDKANSNVRRYIARRAELLGAIRLPNNTFKSNAGTEVVSDIVFLQKRDTIVNDEPSWVYTGKDADGFEINQYFVDHPEMVLGMLEMESGPFGQKLTCVPYDNVPFETLLNNAIQNIHAEIESIELPDGDISDDKSFIPADLSVRNYSYTLVDGDIYYRKNSFMELISVPTTAQARIKGMIEIRDCVRELIRLQTENYPNSEIVKEQKRLNTIYDKYTAKYGILSSRANKSAFLEDSSYSLLCSLEVVNENGELIRKADMFSKRTIKPHVKVTSVDTASEALAISIGEKAFVDMEYMSSLTGKTEEELFNELKGSIFLNPVFEYGSHPENKYLMADEYLSGNVREKLAVAKKSAELYPEDYQVNVEALEKVQPAELTASEIDVRLGATWLPETDVQNFIFELLHTPRYLQWNMKVHYNQITAEWSIENKTHDRGNVLAHSTYGTARINAYNIIENTLNLKDVRIFDYIEEDGKRKPVLNKKETAIAQAKQEMIKQEFKEWIWSDPARRERLCKLYNEKFNSMRAREYDGSHITFGGINPEIKLREHQTNAIARIMYGGNTLLAHTVGAGKTFEIVAASQEMKRLGLCNKSLIVVPNHLTEQWASEYLQLYPAANILVATRKDFETKNRKKFCARIATGDYDAIIIGHSQFEKIPLSVDRQKAMLQAQLDEITDGIAEVKYNRGERITVKQLEKTKKSLQTKLEKLNDQSRKDDVVTFEELGVDRLFVDEAHSFKNLYAYSKMRNVGGIAQTEAQKSSDLYMKCRYLDEITGNKGTIFATGTPVSNSMVELFTMQRYLQNDTLKRNNLQHFDSWASTFGETVTAIELAPEGTGYRAKTRFAKFYNLPELMMMFRQVADIQTADMLKLPVPEADKKTITINPSEMQKEIVSSLSERAENVRAKMVDSSVDNMLLITNDGRKLALDQRLINDMLPDDPNGKVSVCADNVYNIWAKTSDKKSTQLVFSDLSTPHNDGKFNVYDDLKKKLVAKGIPEKEIAYIHSADTEAKKKDLFSKVRSGQVRVLIGSTFKMGAGTNVQKKLIALHHLDCPWRPSDLEQREGRIVRQGNENPKVEINTYVTKDTFDAYLYQLVENKQKFIGQIMTSKSPVRSAEDVDEQALSYAEIKALATGNPYIKEKMDLDVDVAKLKLLKQNHLSQKYMLEDMLIKYPREIQRIENVISGMTADMQIAENNPPATTDYFPVMVIEDVTYNDKKAAGTAILAACKAMTSPDPKLIGSYRGFKLELSYDRLEQVYKIAVVGKLKYPLELGGDIYGNLTRIENVIAGIPGRKEANEALLENTLTQKQNAEIEVKKPFPQEKELSEKSERLAELNSILDMGHTENEIVDGDLERDTPEKTKDKGKER